MLSFVWALMHKLGYRFYRWLVAGSATGQGGRKGKERRWKALSACASWLLVQHQQHKLIASHADQWAPENQQRQHQPVWVL